MTVTELFAKLGLDVDGASFAKGSLAITGINQGLELLAKVGQFAGKVFDTFIGSVADAGDHAFKTAQKIGISVEALQELEYAARLSDLSAEQLGTSLKFLSRSAFEAFNGGKEASEVYKKLGVNVRGADGKVRPADDLLGELADKFAAMPDGVEKTAHALKVFGRSGTDMIPWLNGGSAGIAELRAEAHKLGIVLDADTAKLGEEFNDNISRMKAAVTGLIYTIGVPLLKALAPIIEGMVAWIKLNGAWIRSGVTKAFKVTAAILTAVWNALKMIAMFDWTPALFALAAVFMVVKGAAIGAALAAGAAWVAALWPILAIIAAVAAVILILDDLYNFLTGGDSIIGRYAKTMIDFFENLLPNAIEFWRGAILDFWGWLVDQVKAIGSKIMDAARGAGKAILGAVPFVGGSLTQKVFGGGDSPAGAVSNSTGAVANSSVYSPSMSPTINVNAQTNASPAEIGTASKDAWQDWFDSQMRANMAAVGGG